MWRGGFRVVGVDSLRSKGFATRGFVALVLLVCEDKKGRVRDGFGRDDSE
jgi:hypothetical protein